MKIDCHFTGGCSSPPSTSKKNCFSVESRTHQNHHFHQDSAYVFVIFLGGRGKKLRHRNFDLAALKYIVL